MAGSELEAKNALAGRLDDSWVNSKYWQGARAEIGIYEAREMVRRRPRRADLTLIFERLTTTQGKKESAKDRSAFFAFQQVSRYDVGIFPRNETYVGTFKVPEALMLSVHASRQEWGKQFLKRVQYSSADGRKPFGVFQVFDRNNPTPTAVTFDLGNLQSSLPYEIFATCFEICGLQQR